MKGYYLYKKYKQKYRELKYNLLGGIFTDNIQYDNRKTGAIIGKGGVNIKEIKRLSNCQINLYEHNGEIKISCNNKIDFDKAVRLIRHVEKTGTLPSMSRSVGREWSRGESVGKGRSRGESAGKGRSRGESVGKGRSRGDGAGAGKGRSRGDGAGAGKARYIEGGSHIHVTIPLDLPFHKSLLKIFDIYQRKENCIIHNGEIYDLSEARGITFQYYPNRYNHSFLNFGIQGLNIKKRGEGEDGSTYISNDWGDKRSNCLFFSNKNSLEETVRFFQEYLDAVGWSGNIYYLKGRATIVEEKPESWIVDEAKEKHPRFFEKNPLLSLDYSFTGPDERLKIDSGFIFSYCDISYKDFMINRSNWEEGVEKKRGIFTSNKFNPIYRIYPPWYDYFLHINTRL